MSHTSSSREPDLTEAEKFQQYSPKPDAQDPNVGRVSPGLGLKESTRTDTKNGHVIMPHLGNETIKQEMRLRN